MTLAANYRTIPDIPLSDYAAAVTVFPLMSKYINPEHTRYPLVRDEEPQYGFRVMYREVPEKYLADEYSNDWDLYASLTEDRIVTSVEELEQALSGYVKDFGAFHFGTGLW